MTLKYSRAQVQDREFAQIKTVGRPNRWWHGPVDGSDCMAAQAWILGIRTNPASTTAHEISIAAFRNHFGWNEVHVADAKAGFLLLEEWTSPQHPHLVGVPTHIEWINTIDHAHGTVDICSGNTGPMPGTAEPNGFWRKTRQLNGSNFLAAIEVPYADVPDTSPYGIKAPVGLSRKDRKAVAAFLNEWNDRSTAGLRHTTTVKDGNPGPNYWTLVQSWGRANNVYGPGYLIDGEVGPRTRQVEAIISKRVHAAAKK